MIDDTGEDMQPQVGGPERLLVGLIVLLGLPAVAVGLYLSLGQLPAEEPDRRQLAEFEQRPASADRWRADSHFTAGGFPAPALPPPRGHRTDSNVTSGGVGNPRFDWPPLSRPDSNTTTGPIAGPYAETPFDAPSWAPAAGRPMRREAATGAPLFFQPWDAVAGEPTSAERRAMELAAKLRQTEGAEREKLREQVSAALHAAFDERRERLIEAIDRLAQQLDTLRQLDAQRGQRKDEIVQRRLRELLGEPDPLAWELSPAATYSPATPSAVRSPASQVSPLPEPPTLPPPAAAP